MLVKMVLSLVYPKNWILIYQIITQRHRINDRNIVQTKKINMKNAYKLNYYPSPTDANDLVRLSDLSQYISLNKMAHFVEGVEFTTTTPGSTNHTPFLIKFNYLLEFSCIEFYKEERIVNMRIEKWRYNMCDLGYNWSFSFNLEDLHDFCQS